MGFGPAAFHLEGRDSWIGWDRPAQQENRCEVIGLARFLIRPGLRCANLASRCYGLVLSRVAQDWHQRYGVKPVLVESYVDRSTHTGVSWSAANWRRLGSSRGRGRSSPSAKVQPKTPKDVWVYELRPKARQQLQQRKSAQIIVPRSILQGPSSRNWVEEELDGLKLGSMIGCSNRGANSGRSFRANRWVDRCGCRCLATRPLRLARPPWNLNGLAWK